MPEDSTWSAPTTGATTATTAASSTIATASSGPTPAPWAGADFTELDAFLDATAGEAFAIVEDDVPIHEWYRTDASYRRDIASAQKSLLSLLVGRAIGEGMMTVDTAIDDVLGTSWTPRNESAGITVAHLLAMTSGLDNSFTAFAPPGTAWRYSDAFSALFDVVTTATGRELNDVAADWLFAPAGATSSVFYQRPSGQYSPTGLRSTVPDLISIGRLVLAGGPPGLAAGWLDDSLAPSQALNLSYGYLWWLLGAETFRLPGPRPTALPGPMVPSAPSDMVAALGKDDQKLYVSPELRLVVARLGGSGSAKPELARSDFDSQLWTRLTALRG